jgi:hypothetical protein
MVKRWWFMRVSVIFQRDGHRVRLFTRNGHDWTSRYPDIVEAALRNSVLQLMNCSTGISKGGLPLVRECVRLIAEAFARKLAGSPVHSPFLFFFCAFSIGAF